MHTTERENIKRALKSRVGGCIKDDGKVFLPGLLGGIFIFPQNMWASGKKIRFGFRYVRCEAVRSTSKEGSQEAPRTGTPELRPAVSRYVSGCWQPTLIS